MPSNGVPVWHVWRDDDGISHITLRHYGQFSQASFIQGIPEIWRTSGRQSPSNVLFLRIEPGQTFDWHENPVTQWAIALSGRYFLETMDGARVELGPGDLVFGADQNCRCIEGRQGHLSGSAGAEPVVLMLIQVDSDPFTAGGDPLRG